MKLNNASRASKIRLLFMLIPFLTLLVVGLSYLAFNVRSLDTLYAGITCIVIYVISMIVLKYNFISFYAGYDKVAIKYKSLSPTLNPNNSIVINADDFHKYEIKKRVFGMLNSLYVYQITDGVVAKFPSISLSALSETEIEKISKAMQLLVDLNSKKN